MEPKEDIRKFQGGLQRALVCHIHLFLSLLILFEQSLSIMKAISQGQKPVAGNPENDMTVENIERQVRVRRHAMPAFDCFTAFEIVLACMI